MMLTSDSLAIYNISIVTNENSLYYNVYKFVTMERENVLHRNGVSQVNSYKFSHEWQPQHAVVRYTWLK